MGHVHEVVAEGKGEATHIAKQQKHADIIKSQFRRNVLGEPAETDFGCVVLRMQAVHVEESNFEERKDGTSTNIQQEKDGHELSG